MGILIVHVPRLEQTKWTAAYCPWCGQWEAVRIVIVYEIILLYVVPVSKDRKGRAFVCDFCERSIEDDESIGDIRVEGWYPDEGFAKLWPKLAPEEPMPAHDPNAEQRIDSLLAATAKSVSPDRAEVGHGLITGLILGILLSFPTVYLLLQAKVLTSSDEFKVYFLGLIIAALGGAIIGALAQFLLWRPRLARKKLRTACCNYSVDAEILIRSAENYRGIVRRAAIRVAEELP